MTIRNLAIWYLNLMLFDGPVSATEILSTGYKLGFSQRTLARAKADMKISSFPERSAEAKITKWWWAL